MNIDCTTELLSRMRNAVREARLEHGLAQAELAELAGVGATTVRKLECGEYVKSALLVRLGAAVLVLDVYRQPRLDHDPATGLGRARPAEVVA